MQSRQTANVIVFNGEIYNYQAIKRTLEASGNRFFGRSDTEVLLAAIDTWGVDEALDKIKGMYSFAVWNDRSGELILARDRIGEKPLYFCCLGKRFLFASELKGILAAVSRSDLSLDPQALNQYLRYGYISAPHSIFQQVKKLPPGCKLELDVNSLTNAVDKSGGSFVIKPYWRIHDAIPDNPSYHGDDVEGALSDLETVLNTIIQEQAVADVPLGSFLSGGVDSSLVTAILRQQASRSIETFTIGFEDPDFNEAEHAKAISRHLGTNHNELYLSERDILDVVPRIPDIYDEPFANASQIPTFLVSQFARTKLKVCLSGDGGDELFTGYNRYIHGAKISNLQRRMPVASFARLLSPIAAISPATLDGFYYTINRCMGRKGGANFGHKVHKLVRALAIGSPSQLYQFLCSYTEDPSALLRHPALDQPLENVIPFESDFVLAAMAWDQRWYLPGDNLVKSDRASMAASLEMRAPLLDQDLIEFSWKLPTSLKYRDGKSKWLLRQLLYRYVPQKLIERPKMGFTVPISRWIRTTLKPYATELLEETFIKEQGLFDPTAVNQILQQHFSGKQDFGNQIWTLLMFQAWYKRYMP